MARQTAFLQAFAELGTVTGACRMSGVGRRSVYDWIAHDQRFALEFDAAREAVADLLEAECRRRGVDGSRRFETSEDEDRLLAAADPYMHAFTVAMVDTASRPGEIRTWQWKNLNLHRQTWVIEARKEKNADRTVGDALHAVTPAARDAPARSGGEPWPGEADVFGDELGRVLTLATIRERWTALVAKVGLEGLQLRDMRHEETMRAGRRK